MKELIDRFDDERRDLARQLHSTALQHLAALQIDLCLIESAGLPERAAKALAESMELAQACSKEIRSISGRLHPPLLDQAGLAAALRVLAVDTGCKVGDTFPDDVGPVPSRVALGAFRIIEEVIADLDQPGMMTLDVSRDEKSISLSITGTSRARDERAMVVRRLKALHGRRTRWVHGNVWGLRFRLPLTSAES